MKGTDYRDMLVRRHEQHEAAQAPGPDGTKGLSFTDYRNKQNLQRWRERLREVTHGVTGRD